MPSYTLPKDRYGVAIQTLAPSTTATNVTVAGASARTALPAGSDIVRIGCTTACYFEFGTSGVSATTSSAVFTAGAEVFRVPDAATHVAFLQVSAGGVASVTAMV